MLLGKSHTGETSSVIVLEERPMPAGVVWYRVSRRAMSHRHRPMKRYCLPDMDDGYDLGAGLWKTMRANCAFGSCDTGVRLQVPGSQVRWRQRVARVAKGYRVRGEPGNSGHGPLCTPGQALLSSSPVLPLWLSLASAPRRVQIGLGTVIMPLFGDSRWQRPSWPFGVSR